MIANLLDNAIKYTPPGGRVNMSIHAASDRRIKAEVIDTGIGISAEDLPHIFDRFYRCDPSRSQTGTGLGLSFARTVARAHGGDITVASKPDLGSTFSVILPGMKSNVETA
jgi:signal transduction histidine kinase